MIDLWNNYSLYILIALLGVIFIALLVIRFRRRLLPQSLSNRLPWAFLAVAGVSVLVMSFILALRIQATLETQKGRDFLVQAELSANRLAEQIDNQISRLEDIRGSYSVTNQIFFAQRPLNEMSTSERADFIQKQETEWTNPDEAFLRRSIYFNPVSVELQAVAGDNPLFSQIIVTDQYGGLAGTIGDEPEHYFFGDKEWWQTAWNSEQENALFVGRPYIAEDGKTVLIDIVIPL